MNVNESTIEPFEGCDVESDLYDVGSFTNNLEIDCFSRWDSVMEDHLEEATYTNASLSISVDSSNASFQDEQASTELIRILKGIITKIEEGGDNISGDLLDVNGNKVGSMDLEIGELTV